MKRINVIAGRPGAGKTSYAKNQMIKDLYDPNNVVVFIGNERHALAYRYPGVFLTTSIINHPAEGIGMALDVKSANYDTNIMVNLYYDMNDFEKHEWRRDLLVSAAKAGICVTVLVQSFSQLDMGNLEWLNTYCDCYIISKDKPPRPATEEEINSVYR